MKAVLLVLLLSLNAPLVHSAAPAGPDEYEKTFDTTVKGKSLEEYYAEINSGWQPALLRLKKSLRPDRSYMVLHVIEPGPVFDQRSGNDLRRSMLSGKGLVKLLEQPLSIGHVFVSWRCKVGNEFVEGTTGQTGEFDRQAFKMMLKGWGIAPMFSWYSDGHLQTPRLLNQEFDDARAMHNLAVEVSEDVCQGAMQFVQDYLFHENQPHKRFGLIMDPGKFEGGGCGSFGVALLDKSGFFGRHDLRPLLWRQLRANPKLFGYGLDEVPAHTHVFQLRNTGSSGATIARMFLRNWNDETGTGPLLKQQDPEMLLLFLKTIYRLNYPALTEEFVETREYKERSYVTRLKRVTINAEFDEQAANLVQATKGWMKDLREEGYRARLGKIGRPDRPYTAIILDRH
jgi:hypothetical protein